ncbi:hypothetical protein [Carp edema virus]|nr:hypothetical protein [Carp edema virus]
MEATLDRLAFKWVDACGQKIGAFKDDLKKEVYGLQNPVQYRFYTRDNANTIKGQDTHKYKYKVMINKVNVDEDGIYYFELKNSNVIVKRNEDIPINDIFELKAGLNTLEATYELNEMGTKDDNIVIDFEFRKATKTDGKLSLPVASPVVHVSAIFVLSEIPI